VRRAGRKEKRGRRSKEVLYGGNGVAAGGSWGEIPELRGRKEDPVRKRDSAGGDETLKAARKGHLPRTRKTQTEDRSTKPHSKGGGERIKGKKKKSEEASP